MLTLECLACEVILRKYNKMLWYENKHKLVITLGYNDWLEIVTQ